jgi:hypothetical protein
MKYLNKYLNLALACFIEGISIILNIIIKPFLCKEDGGI